jgi:hypothetical protein
MTSVLAPIPSPAPNDGRANARRGQAATLLATGWAAIALFGCGGGTVVAKLGEGGAVPASARAQGKRHPARKAVREVNPPAPAETGSSGAIPAASAGTNGSFAPSTSAQSKPIVPRTHEALGRLGAGPTAILLNGIALAPPQAPEAIQGAIDAANAIIGRPYVWGGGHTSWYSQGYDCSGAVSFALFGGGLIPKPLTSSQLESWGVPGPGRWLTVYANATHAYAVIAGLRWDTVGDARGTGPRWHPNDAYPQGFVARHAPGY